MIGLITGASAGSITAQTLFTYGANSVSKEEFLRVYKKNSLNKTPDMSDTALNSYLDLYSLFRMKVSEAEKEKIDTLKRIQDDLNGYRKQLAKNYLTDDNLTTRLVKEAYDRMKEDVRVEHILVSCPPGADTVAAYRKIDSIYHVIEAKKATFEQLAMLSDDKGTREKGGDLGWITGMQVVYPFENAAYNTPVGKMSQPFRSQFGYHIVKVIAKRADRGQVKVAQILLASPKSRGESGLAEAKKRADSVEMMLKQGVPFHELVKKYSDDKYSVNDSGVLRPFGAGHMTPEFEDAAFALKKSGDISEPIKTEYGYHIIKLISKMPLQPYDSIASQLKHKVENDSRAQTAREAYFDKIKQKNGYKEYKDNIDEIFQLVAHHATDTGKNKGMFKSIDFAADNKPVFELAGTKYSQYDFVKSMEALTRGKLQGSRPTVLRDGFNIFVNNTVSDFEERRLAEENPEFKHLIEEYKDGIMLFELMDRNVWSKATKDSAGLKEFYDGHKSKYTWEPGFEGSVYTARNKETMDTVVTMINSGATDEQIVKILNTQKNPDRVSIQRGRYEFSKFKDASQSELTRNKMKMISAMGSSYKMVYARQIFNTQTTKTLDEARGYVVADYQNFLEEQWNKKMRAEFPVKVNEKVFNSMVKTKTKK